MIGLNVHLLLISEFAHQIIHTKSKLIKPIVKTSWFYSGRHRTLVTGSRGLGVNFLPAKGFKRGPPHCVETIFSYRYCKLKTVIQWYIAKIRGGYTLEMRDRRCRAAPRIEAPKAPRGVGFLRRGCPPPQPTRGSGGALWAPPTRSKHISAPQKLSSRRLLKFNMRHSSW